MVARGEEADRNDRLSCPPREDDRPPADVVGEMTTEVPAGAGKEGADEVADAELRLGGAELLDRSDPHERPGGRGCERAREDDGEQRPERRLDVVAPDQTRDASERPHSPDAIEAGLRVDGQDEHDRRQEPCGCG